MAHVKESVKDLVKTKKIFALWSKCAAKFGKVAKCAMGVKSLRTTVIKYRKANKLPYIH